MLNCVKLQHKFFKKFHKNILIFNQDQKSMEDKIKQIALSKGRYHVELIEPVASLSLNYELKEKLNTSKFYLEWLIKIYEQNQMITPSNVIKTLGKLENLLGNKNESRMIISYVHGELAKDPKLFSIENRLDRMDNHIIQMKNISNPEELATYLKQELYPNSTLIFEKELTEKNIFIKDKVQEFMRELCSCLKYLRKLGYVKHAYDIIQKFKKKVVYLHPGKEIDDLYRDQDVLTNVYRSFYVGEWDSLTQIELRNITEQDYNEVIEILNFLLKIHTVRDTLDEFYKKLDEWKSTDNKTKRYYFLMFKEIVHSKLNNPPMSKDKMAEELYLAREAFHSSVDKTSSDVTLVSNFENILNAVHLSRDNRPLHAWHELASVVDYCLSINDIENAVQYMIYTAEIVFIPNKMFSHAEDILIDAAVLLNPHGFSLETSNHHPLNSHISLVLGKIAFKNHKKEEAIERLKEAEFYSARVSSPNAYIQIRAAKLLERYFGIQINDKIKKKEEQLKIKKNVKSIQAY